MSERNGASTHYTEVVTGSVVDRDNCCRTARRIEEAYARINQAALAKGMVIVSTIQSTVALNEESICYLITVHWVSRENLEAMQRQQTILGGGAPPAGRGRVN